MLERTHGEQGRHPTHGLLPDLPQRSVGLMTALIFSKKVRWVIGMDSPSDSWIMARFSIGLDFFYDFIGTDSRTRVRCRTQTITPVYYSGKHVPMVFFFSNTIFPFFVVTQH